MGFAFLQYREAGIDFGEQACSKPSRAPESVCPGAGSGFRVALRGWIHYSRGRIQEAVHDLNAALDSDPSNADTLLLLSNCYLISGKVTTARQLIVS